VVKDMAKKTLKTAAQDVTKPAVRRSRTTKTVSTPVAASPVRRASSSRTKKPAVMAVADDRGMSAIVAAEVLAAVPEPTYDEVATRAYYVYLRRNGAAGNPDHDWMVALNELRRERGII
jgi:hypothetical protein